MGFIKSSEHSKIKRCQDKGAPLTLGAGTGTDLSAPSPPSSPDHCSGPRPLPLALAPPQTPSPLEGASTQGGKPSENTGVSQAGAQTPAEDSFTAEGVGAPVLKTFLESGGAERPPGRVQVSRPL